MASSEEKAEILCGPTDDQGEPKKAPVSFVFTKTHSKFIPVAVDAATKKDDKDYLIGIDRKELQR